jgi:hypothetical protein
MTRERSVRRDVDSFDPTRHSPAVTWEYWLADRSGLSMARTSQGTATATAWDFDETSA